MAFAMSVLAVTAMVVPNAQASLAPSRSLRADTPLLPAARSAAFRQALERFGLKAEDADQIVHLLQDDRMVRLGRRATAWSSRGRQRLVPPDEVHRAIRNAREAATAILGADVRARLAERRDRMCAAQHMIASRLSASPGARPASETVLLAQRSALRDYLVAMGMSESDADQTQAELSPSEVAAVLNQTIQVTYAGVKGSDVAMGVAGGLGLASGSVLALFAFTSSTAAITALITLVVIILIVLVWEAAQS